MSFYSHLFGFAYAVDIDDVDDLTPAARDVLEKLNECEMWMTPAVLAFNSYVAKRQHIANTCQELYDEGLLERELQGTRPYYRITDEGKHLLR